MGTSCTVTMEVDGKIKGVRINYDGYPEWVGKVLIESYNTEEKILELFSYGEISSLEHTIDETLFYSRDRNERLWTYEEDSLKEHLRNNGEEYNYYFDTRNKEWGIV